MCWTARGSTLGPCTREQSTTLRPGSGDLRHEEWEKLGLAGLALALSLVATEFDPELAVALFLGAMFMWALGVRAIWRRWDLVERLSGDRDAYAISEVLDLALREATMERRHTFAALVRAWLDRSETDVDERLRSVADELDALATELEDETLELDPASAVACLRLLTDVMESPLLNRHLPATDLRSRVRQIRAGFRLREPAP
jgi:hypothetical protein